LVLNPFDLNIRDRTAGKTRQHDATKAVADGDAEAPFERLDGDPAVNVGQRLAVCGNLVRQFQTAPANSHRPKLHRFAERTPPDVAIRRAGSMRDELDAALLTRSTSVVRKRSDVFDG